MIDRLGREINHSDSVYYWAHKVKLKQYAYSKKFLKNGTPKIIIVVGLKFKSSVLQYSNVFKRCRGNGN